MKTHRYRRCKPRRKNLTPEEMNRIVYLIRESTKELFEKFSSSPIKFEREEYDENKKYTLELPRPIESEQKNENNI